MADGKRKIDGHWYWPGEWYPSKKEAREKADRLRRTGQFKSVRVVRFLADRRYGRYYIFTR